MLKLNNVTSYNSLVGVTSDCSTLTEPDGTVHYLGNDEILPVLSDISGVSGVLELKDGTVFGPTDNQVDSGLNVSVRDLTIKGNAVLNNRRLSYSLQTNS